MKFYSNLLNISLNKISWVLLFSVLSFCLCASLYTQHILNHAPSAICIQERVFLLGLWGLSFVGIFYRKCLYFRGVVLTGWLLTSIGGFKTSTKHLTMQIDPSAITDCITQYGFPPALPLNEWFPSIFMPSGVCDESILIFGGISITQLFTSVFAVNVVLSAIIIIIELIACARHDGVWIDGIPSEDSKSDTYSGDH